MVLLLLLLLAQSVQPVTPRGERVPLSQLQPARFLIPDPQHLLPKPRLPAAPRETPLPRGHMEPKPSRGPGHSDLFVRGVLTPTLTRRPGLTLCKQWENAAVTHEMQKLHSPFHKDLGKDLGFLSSVLLSKDKKTSHWHKETTHHSGLRTGTDTNMKLNKNAQSLSFVTQAMKSIYK